MCPDEDDYAPAFIAAHEGHVGVISSLIGLRADIEVGCTNFSSPLHMVLRPGGGMDNRRPMATLLVNHGVEVRRSLMNASPSGAKLVLLTMMTQLFDSVGLGSNRAYDGAATSVAKCSLFSLTKLLSRASRGDSDCCDDGDDDGATQSVHGTSSEEHDMFEIAVGHSLQQHSSTAVITQMQGTCFVLRRRLTRIAWRVYQASLLLDGDRITLAAKARRYMELACFLFDLTMLGDVVALRMTCKSNGERRRFPVYGVVYQELEGNIIEECVAYGSSRFVSTAIVYAVIAIHHCY